MSFALLFWILMLLWLFQWVGVRFGGIGGPYVYASELLLFVLIALLGWHAWPFHP
jgi:hypothetical protein